jgi:hypothetical protein
MYGLCRLGGINEIVWQRESRGSTRGIQIDDVLLSATSQAGSFGVKRKLDSSAQEVLTAQCWKNEAIADTCIELRLLSHAPPLFARLMQRT